MEKLLKILKSIHPRADFANETALVDKRILDSLDIIALIGELEETFDVEIGVEYIEPENFNSVDAMAKLLKQLGADL
ncbi:MAG: phosphopantetheine-binding protein [Oscillospiraceae bacterium]|jgi:acyl carrier protein|nr:phosphopantetheine-binding protein [Oscillospiraceae bacterium]